jgi:CRISPR-associated protein Cas2
MAQFLVVSYDISNDRRRTRVMNLLRDYGRHVQYRVFECLLTQTQIRKMIKGLLLIVDPVDSIRICYFCKDDAERAEFLGKGDPTLEDLF